jgi:hypothetical protein
MASVKGCGGAQLVDESVIQSLFARDTRIPLTSPGVVYEGSSDPGF